MERSGFSPLHPSLVNTTSRDAERLSNIQALYLISTLSVLITEYESRGNAIQQLVNRQSPPSAASSPVKSDRLEALENEIKNLKAKNQQNEYLIEKLKSERIRIDQKLESDQQRNMDILNSIKKQFYLDSSNYDPVISKIIEGYEEKCNRLQKKACTDKPNFFEDISEYSGYEGTNDVSF